MAGTFPFAQVFGLALLFRRVPVRVRCPRPIPTRGHRTTTDPPCPRSLAIIPSGDVLRRSVTHRCITLGVGQFGTSWGTVIGKGATVVDGQLNCQHIQLIPEELSCVSNLYLSYWDYSRNLNQRHSQLPFKQGNTSKSLEIAIEVKTSAIGPAFVRAKGLGDVAPQ